MKQEILDTVLGGSTLGQFYAYLLWAVLGLITSFLIELMRHQDTIKKSGGFSIKVWLKENIARTLLSIIAIICGISFCDQILGAKISTWEAFLAGLATDKIVEALVKLKDTINIGALWNKPNN